MPWPSYTHLLVDALAHFDAAMLDGDGAVGVVDGQEDVVVEGLPEDAEPRGHQGEAALLPPVGLKNTACKMIAPMTFHWLACKHTAYNIIAPMTFHWLACKHTAYKIIAPMTFHWLACTHSMYSSHDIPPVGLKNTAYLSHITPFLYFSFIYIYVIIRFGKFRPPYLGKAIAAARAALPSRYYI